MNTTKSEVLKISIKNKDKISLLYNFRFFFLNVLLPVGCGTLIYTFFRTDSLLVFEWYSTYGLAQPISSLRYFIESKSIIILPNWFLYSFPDMLWVYAGTSYFLSIWVNERNFYSYAWCGICLFLAVGAEFLQYINIIEGTYDNLDVLFYFAGFVLAMKNGLISSEGRLNEQNF